MSCPGGYALHCYCDRKNVEHAFNEFPHVYTAEHGSTCRADARRSGWRLDFKNDVYLCPKCNPRSPRYTGAAP